ncbi:MAG: hypothetical protein K0M40_10560 [Prolixibacteraceae bacterium]|nr:hypothetical protein [Prolixibacteraceae bacterium]
MNSLEFIHKVKHRLWHKLVAFTRNTAIYPYLYRSFWHYKLSKTSSYKNTTCFYSARPNPGAGIGHQLANWIAGYWFAKKFDLKFAHIPFSTQKWEILFGFGEDETKLDDLIKNKYKTQKLPLFNEDSEKEVNLIKAIIDSYSGKKIVFVAEQDQFYKNQYGVIYDIKRKFNESSARRNDQILYDPTHFNIAVHVRRTVVIGNKVILENDDAKALRWLSNDYYEKVLKQVVENIKISRPISIYLFSTGKPDEFAEFSKYGDVHFCSDMDEYRSFLHLIRADLLITSKSSFSYKPALLNNGIKVCPRNFWHNYPETEDWILVENDGILDISKLKQIV